MIKIGIVSNPLDPEAWEEFEVEDARAFLIRHFPSWPDQARIFDLDGFSDWTRAAAIIDPAILARRDVTPRDEAGIERLAELRGPLLVTVPPGDPITAIIAVVAIAVGVAAAFLFMPRINLDTQRQQSPNNALAQRSNEPRPNQRIADIFGTVESVPDLLAQPYTVFEDNTEIEVSYMIVGRGSYAVGRVRDGATAIASIAGSSAAIYGPGTNPNSGDPPDIQIGPAIAEQVKTVRKLNEVNGQTLKPTNQNSIQGEDNIRFVYPDSIEAIGGVDFTEYFTAGDALTILQADISGTIGQLSTNASVRFTSAGEIEFETIDPTSIFTAGAPITIANAGFAGPNDTAGTLYVDMGGTYEIDTVTTTKITLVDPASVNGYWDQLANYPPDRTEYLFADLSTPTATAGLNLNGTYVALSVAAGLITLDDPELVNAAWANVAGLDGGATDYVSPNISRSNESWIGPFTVDLDDCQEIIANVVAMSGLYTLSKKKGRQAALSVGFELEITPIDGNDAATGPAELFAATIQGSATERTTAAHTLIAEPSFAGRASVRLRRTTDSPKDDSYSAVVDETKWRDCYGLAPVGAIDFGDVTTVMTRTVGTAGALSLKERRLNMRVTRKLPERIEGSLFGDLVATDSVADIIAAMCLDSFIGRRSAAEVDFDSIYDTIEAVADYFGSPLATHFGYTFDDFDLSFEETVQIVAQAAFCRAYRQGRVIRLAFESATGDSSLIFNSRNILPDSQKRTVRFGVLDDHDGATLEYIDSTDEAKLTLSLPPEASPTSARKIDQPGIRTRELGYWQLWRVWNKARYQHTTVELQATQEAAILIPNDRVLIADLTRPDILQGECLALAGDGVTVEISDPAALDPAKDWTIFLQHIDGTTEALGAVAGADEYHIVLSIGPRMALSLDAANFARATYMIVPDDDLQTRAFLIADRTPEDDFTETVQAINYSFLYYQNDQLLYWLPVFGSSLTDESAFQISSVVIAGGVAAADGARAKNVYRGAGGGSQLDLTGLAAPSSYTKLGWVRGATQGDLLGNANEQMAIVGGSMKIAHGASSIEVAIADDFWHHWAGTFDANTGEAAIYLDGQLAAIGELDARSAITLDAAIDFDGWLDDLRLYPVVLTATAIRDIFLSGTLTDDEGRALTDDLGRTLIME
jgi:hypothetical protein